MIIIKSQNEIELMREAGKIVAMTHQYLKENIVPGITTGQLDRLAEEFIRKNGGIPAFKGYHGFPGSICSSVNEEVVHGIPGSRTLNEGDIVGIDIGVILKDYYGDGAVTYGVGNISEEAQRLITVTEQSFFEGLKYAAPGNRLSDISHGVQQYVEQNGFSVVRDFVGHGIGRSMHEEPQIPNFGKPGRGPKLMEGMVLAIEPMVNAGGYQVKTLLDNWTVVTRDGSYSSHYEHTIAITKDGYEILTKV
jgi:methionyl aminopeptidase